MKMVNVYWKPIVDVKLQRVDQLQMVINPKPVKKFAHVLLASTSVKLEKDVYPAAVNPVIEASMAVK